MSKEVQRDRNVPTEDVLKERGLVSHSDYSVNIPQATTTVTGIVHADMVEVTLNFGVQFVQFRNLYSRSDKILAGLDAFRH